MTVNYFTPAIHCEGCAASIKRSLGKLKGVETVDVNVETKRVSVEFDDAQTGALAIQERLTMAGFQPEAE